MKIYLDNCCYNRPFDIQENLRDNIDYTEWRKSELVEPDSLEELSRQATAFAKQKHSAEKS